MSEHRSCPGPRLFVRIFFENMSKKLVSGVRRRKLEHWAAENLKKVWSSLDPKTALLAGKVSGDCENWPPFCNPSLCVLHRIAARPRAPIALGRRKARRAAQTVVRFARGRSSAGRRGAVSG
eukprot:gene14618-biopygen8116